MPEELSVSRYRIVEMYLQKLQAATLLFFSGSSLAGDAFLEAELFCNQLEIDGKEVHEHYKKRRTKPNQVLDTLRPEEEAMFMTLMQRLTPHFGGGKDDRTTERKDGCE